MTVKIAIQLERKQKESTFLIITRLIDRSNMPIHEKKMLVDKRS